MAEVSSKISKWNEHNKEWEDKQLVNPFSSHFQPELQQQLKKNKGEDGYGRPKEVFIRFIRIMKICMRLNKSEKRIFLKI